MRTCPRCGAVVRPPGLWSSSWTCSLHGSVIPVHPAVPATPEGVARLAAEVTVPLWLPWPLPDGWLVSGLRWAGDDAHGVVASVLAVSGPNPLPEAEDERGADLLLIGEQPGVGLGAHLAGLQDIDAGATLREQAEWEPAHVKITAAGHDTPMWSVPVDGGVGYVGEASGVWLWLLAWPAPAAAVLLERFALVDLRDPGHPLDPPCGALTPRLSREVP